MLGVPDFVAAWRGEGTYEHNIAREIGCSKFGNINYDGDPYSGHSPALTPHDRHFWDAVEPIVLPLVRVLVDAGWITYTSCEGHCYDDTGRNSELHVGVLLVDPNLDRLRRAVHLATMLTSASRGVPAAFQIYTGSLEDPLCHNVFNVADVYLNFLGGDAASWWHYFNARRPLLDEFCNHLRSASDL
jgi:hypothetical protein